ncbi:hypothetical protein [Jiella sonneratiae]|uniref:UrcA family protein n=1 Tax=Jiella sonneratiae TaxID=2816856 RepID=A0ABS3J2S9_9HYPH|nr:hypothetical protein [Jiella sonneratiae]MBO0903959.1 hypothetical protein [Jiella sonneratiae]
MIIQAKRKAGRKARAVGAGLFALAALAALHAPAFGQSAQSPAAAAEDPIASDPDKVLVEVSLGDWQVRTSLAAKLSRKISDIPLTVKVAPDLADAVCPLDRGALDQQVVVSPTRTCAAKKTTEALEAEVRKVVPAQ